MFFLNICKIKLQFFVCLFVCLMLLECNCTCKSPQIRSTIGEFKKNTLLDNENYQSLESHVLKRLPSKDISKLKLKTPLVEMIHVAIYG